MYCASRAGSKVIESLMSMPSTSVPPLLAACTRSGSPAASAAPPIPSRRTTSRRPIQPISRTFPSPRSSSCGAIIPAAPGKTTWRRAAHAVCGKRREDIHRVLRYIASRLRDCRGDGAAGDADHLPDRQHGAGRSGADAAWRRRRQQPGDRRGLSAQMGPRSADVGSLLDLPARPDARRSRHFHLLAAPGDRGHRAIRARHDRAVHRRRSCCRCCSACRLAWWPR